VLVTDRMGCRRDLAAAVGRALAGGVTAVMLREKDLGHEELCRLGHPIAAACRSAGALFLVNHDAQAAAELRADGVHLGFRSVGVARARAMAGEDALVGRSTHDQAELDAAILEGADYVTFGPVYDTPTKRGLLAPRGEAALRDAAGRATVPVIALGGVASANAPALRRAGAAGIACIREILAAGDETAAARRLVSAWESAR
jgi:thiamine-phosphate pyrophosphorylase